MKYRDGMSKDEYAELMKEVMSLDESYSVADKMQAEFDKQFPADEEYVDEMAELRKAALNHKGQP